MANNRLFLVDTETGDYVLLAKGFGDWGMWPETRRDLEKFLEMHDFAGAQGSLTGFRLMDEFDPDCPAPLKPQWKPDDHCPDSCGQDLNLNPSNLPTRAKLADAVRDAMNAHPIAKEDRSFARFLQALEVMRTYLSWLPEEHREGGDRDLKYIERRLEELLMFRRFVKTFVEMFRSRPATYQNMASAMFATVMSFVKMLKETTGVDLEGKEDTL